MTEQNGHEEHERNSARDDDAGFAALDATEPHFGSSALGNFVSFEPVAPPVEVGGFEALNFEVPAALAEPTLSWEAPAAVAPPIVGELPYEDEPPYPDEPPYRANLRIRQSLCTLKQSTLKQSTRGNIGYPRTKRHPQTR